VDNYTFQLCLLLPPFQYIQPNLMPLNRKWDLSNDFQTQLMPFERKSNVFFFANLMTFEVNLIILMPILMVFRKSNDL
jgi:hypothetical protein